MNIFSRMGRMTDEAVTNIVNRLNAEQLVEKNRVYQDPDAPDFLYPGLFPWREINNSQLFRC
jgi:hypothetical protein